MRSCWSFSWESYSLNTSDPAVIIRRLCMWAILLVRTAISILSVMFRAYGGYIVSMALGVILGVLGFFFIAYCLALIGEVQGRRKVMGVLLVSLEFTS